MEAETYVLIKKNVKQILNIDLERYKDQQMQRRLDSWLVRVGAPSWPAYFQKVQSDEAECRKFRDYLTINVSSFFRDPERWTSLRKDILPELLQASAKQRLALHGGLRLWSAGCSIGAEIYTLSMILDEDAPGRNHYLLATDLDRGAIAKAKAGGPYTADETANVTPDQRAKYFQPGGPPFFIKDALAKKIAFKEHDMLLNPFETDFDLIVCRNVVIYFTAEAKDQLYKKFSDSLRPGGILFVGGTEIISRPGEFNLKTQGISFYRKIG